MSKSEEISTLINQLSFDLKAEMLVAILMEQSGVPEIQFVFNGQHKRDWSRDVDCSTVGNQEAGEDMLYVCLNRDGIYDLLPEAVFHGMNSEESWSGEDMAKESIKLRAEEKEARLFFRPFENEIFLHRVQVSMMENRLFADIYKDLLTGMIPDFWKIMNGLPVRFVTKLKRLLPEVYKVCGDMDLTVQCLEYILNEKVMLSTSAKVPDNDSGGAGIPGGSILGSDFILGSAAAGFIKSLSFRIGPLASPENIHLIENGSMDRFLDCFYGYFIPVELNVDTEYIFSDEDRILALDGEEDHASFLAYNSVIQ